MKFRSEEGEILLSVRPLSQSSGRVMDGGDCGYCCVGGIFGLGSIMESYEFVESRMREGYRSRQNMSGWRWDMLLRSLGYGKCEERIGFRYYKVGCVPVPWGNFNFIRRVRRRLESGRVLVSSIRFNSSIPPEPVRCGDSDHNVLITGWRFRWVAHPTVVGAASGVEEIRISCSVKGEYWMEWDKFLYWHGGYPIFSVPLF